MSLDKIREQVEYYFSNSNYCRDRFIQEVARKNNELIPIDTILTFNRLKSLQATKESVRKAVENSQVVSLEGDSLKKIKTDEYLAYVADKDISKRIAVMEGFPTDMTLDEIKEMLRPHCQPLRISMRRDSQKKFNGTCVVEFKTADDASAALSMSIEITKDAGSDESKRQKMEPTTIKIISKDAYDSERKQREESERNKKFIDKVKRDFLDKLYEYESEEQLDILGIKKMVKNVAFVDLERKVLRMKYREDWETNEFEAEGKKIKLTKMIGDKAQAYVDSLQIKKVSKKK